MKVAKSRKSVDREDYFLSSTRLLYLPVKHRLPKESDCALSANSHCANLWMSTIYRRHREQPIRTLSDFVDASEFGTNVSGLTYVVQGGAQDLKCGPRWPEMV